MALNNALAMSSMKIKYAKHEKSENENKSKI